ncbi:hypothetical protein LL252_18915 [Alcanivorax marinus]|uniref:Uncharacterized protein n=1 Tax=Alloalcanivorax marinus TaxID=1177169 RepID=A0A9Q3UQP0_9GAMM|nr:hypothetical protein [Alloalcanivorax marinus]MCC4310640.1 hypothetical protein [Alloalcanivorax marinus]
MSIEMKKLALAGLVGVAAYGFAGSAAAQTCAGTSTTATDGTWECVEYQDGTSSTYNAAPTGVWFGPGGTDSNSDTFTFTGNSTLNYSFITATCGLTLEGHVRKNSDNSISIRVVDGDVSGTGTCASIGVGGFPWYASDSTSFSDSSSVDGAGTPGDVHPPATGVTSANIGQIEVSIFGSTVCTGYMPDVEFGNGNPVTNSSYFDFDNDIVGTACGVSGVLSSVLNEDVNAW